MDHRRTTVGRLRGFVLLHSASGGGQKCALEKRRADVRKSSFTAILEREGNLFVALCPELDVASQGATVEEATANLREAVELFQECADRSEIDARFRDSGHTPKIRHLTARIEETR